MNETIIQRVREMADRHGDLVALQSKDALGVFQDTTYRELLAEAARLASGLAAVGVKRGQHVGLISDTRKEWMVADLALLGMGAIDVPRGSDSTADELTYILDHAGCAITLVENATQLEKLAGAKRALPQLKTVVVIESSGQLPVVRGLDVLTLQDVVDKAAAGAEASFLTEIDAGKGSDLATIIYTSGTTGEPKGVMLTHANFVYQVGVVPEYVPIGVGDVLFSVLPVWHSYERLVEYVAICQGASIAYSQPIRDVMLADLQATNPTYLPSVPRIWEGLRAGVYRNVDHEGGIKKVLFNFFIAVGATYSKWSQRMLGRRPRYTRRPRVVDSLLALIPTLAFFIPNLLGSVLVFSKIKARLGNRFKAAISGAGALPGYVDDFFAAAGILVLEGYGLTECAPLVSVRKQKQPVAATVGPPMRGTEVKVLDEHGSRVRAGARGVLHVRGPQVMRGYYQRPEETRAILTADGWLNTGDIAVLTVDDEISITGRQKDTIVLLGGENIEPEPIEDLLRQSTYIDQAMIVGQDQRFLGALIVPSQDAAAAFAQENGLGSANLPELTSQDAFVQLIRDEVQARISTRAGFKSFERIAKIALLDAAFEPGVELTHTLKMRRHVIGEKHATQIAALFS
jgi:long-chain acyl-CoA synthetase